MDAMGDETQQQAMDEYRVIWITFLGGASEPFLPGSALRYPLSTARVRMDELQNRIAERWEAFADTLPGYRAWWGSMAAEFASPVEAPSMPRRVGG